MAPFDFSCRSEFIAIVGEYVAEIKDTGRPINGSLRKVKIYCYVKISFFFTSKCCV